MKSGWTPKRLSCCDRSWTVRPYRRVRAAHGPPPPRGPVSAAGAGPVPLLRPPVDRLKAQLTDLHPRLQLHRVLAVVKDFQADLRAGVGGIVHFDAEAGVNRRGGDGAADAEPGPAALAFDPCRQPG